MKKKKPKKLACIVMDEKTFLSAIKKTEKEKSKKKRGEIMEKKLFEALKNLSKDWEKEATEIEKIIEGASLIFDYHEQNRKAKTLRGCSLQLRNILEPRG